MIKTVFFFNSTLISEIKPIEISFTREFTRVNSLKKERHPSLSLTNNKRVFQCYADDNQLFISFLLLQFSKIIISSP